MATGSALALTQTGESTNWSTGIMVAGIWIPVGSQLAEAIVHDAVDVHRPVRKQMLRGALETTRSKGSANSDALLRWLADSLAQNTS